LIFELLLLFVLSIAIIITLFSFNPTYNALVKASVVDNNDIKPILKKQNWKAEVTNSSFVIGKNGNWECPKAYHSVEDDENSSMLSK
jgi:flagellar biosynthesis/type III secretory pathway M-ring protein FliF/YscJ